MLSKSNEQPNPGRGADHAGGPRLSADAHHRPQRSASVPGDRNRRCKAGWGIHGETFDFDNDDSAASATRLVKTRSRWLVDDEQTGSRHGHTAIFCSCCPCDSPVPSACPLIPGSQFRVGHGVELANPHSIEHRTQFEFRIRTRLDKPRRRANWSDCLRCPRLVHDRRKTACEARSGR